LVKPKNIYFIGGASRDRTDDLIVANDALSQLSYSPIRRCVGVFRFYQPSLDFAYTRHPPGVIRRGLIESIELNQSPR
jgi:hypothetical protein